MKVNEMGWKNMFGKAVVLLALLAGVAALLAACSSNGGGEGADSGGGEFPSGNMEVVVPYAAGGPTDLAARTVGSYYEEAFGETVIVENQPGASGTQAMNTLMGSEADGTTIAMIAVPGTIVTPFLEDVGYGPDDFETVGVITVIPSVLVVGADSEYETAEDFFAAAEENPGELNVGTPGATTSMNIELQRLADEYDIEVSTIPFQGNAEISSALLGNNIDAAFLNASEDILANIEGGDFRALAVSPEEQVDFLPDVPTLADLGYEDLTYSTSYFGLAVPTGTPQETIDELEATLDEALQDEETIGILGEEYVPEEFIGAEEFRGVLDEIVEVYQPVIEGGDIEGEE